MQQLEEAGAFVRSLDARRSWFRYHQLFADLLQLELRGSAPSELPALHEAAATWHAEHGYPVEAVRHAQAAQNWDLAARVLSDHWVGLGLAGLGGTAHEFFARFPAGVIADGIALAHEIDRPYLEFTGLAFSAQLMSWRSFPLGAERGQQAIELAQLHGWADETITGVAYLAIGVTMVTQGRLDDAEHALGQAERIVRTEVEPAAGMRLHYGRGLLEFVSGRPDAAVRAFEAAERLATPLVTPHTLAPRLRSHLLQALARRGETRHVEQALADLGGPERERGEIRIAEASLRLAQAGPKAAVTVLAPVIDGSAPLQNAHLWEVQAFLLQAIACDALGGAAAARRALERALDLAEPECLLFPFLYDPAPALLERHRRSGTAHAPSRSSAGTHGGVP